MARVRRLQPSIRGHQVSDRLLDRNRRLRAAHGQLARVVVGLMATDLARHKDK